MDRVQLGNVSVTHAAMAALAESGLVAADLLDRFRAGDWGADDPAGRLHCDFCLAHEMPLVSWYTLAGGTRIAVACSADRSETLVALASEHGPEEVSAEEGYAAWSRTYDTDLNQLIAVEQIYVGHLLGQGRFEAVLDAATGTGRHALALARRGANVTAFDSSPEMLAVAQGRAAAEQLPITFLQASLSQPLPLADGRFDLAVCALAFCHLPEISAPCHEFFRVLRTGGRFLLTDFHPDALDSGWRTDTWSGLRVYRLTNYQHQRTGYLAAVEGAGFRIRAVHDIPIADIPTEVNHAGLIERWGQMNFCIVVDAEKQ